MKHHVYQNLFIVLGGMFSAVLTQKKVLFGILKWKDIAKEQDIGDIGICP